MFYAQLQIPRFRKFKTGKKRHGSHQSGESRQQGPCYLLGAADYGNRNQSQGNGKTRKTPSPPPLQTCLPLDPKTQSLLCGPGFLGACLMQKGSRN